MTSNRPIENERAAGSPLAELVKSATPAPGPNERNAGWQKLQWRIERRRGVQRAVLWLAPALMLLGTGLGYWLHGLRGSELSFTVAGGQVLPDGEIRSGGGLASLKFSDRSEIDVEPGTRAALQGLTEQGAKLAIQNGELDVRIYHRPESRWQFMAGPYSVAVHGTAFRMSWRAADRRLEVRMRSGQVEVTGPLVRDGLMVHGGQLLVVDGATGELAIRSLPDQDAASASADREKEAAPVTPAESAEPVVSENGEPLAPAAAAPSAAAPVAHAGRESWSELLRAGKFQTIVDQAQSMGLDQALSTASSENLAALADAARYLRMSSLAERALVTQRSRFPHSHAAQDAAFFLARMQEGPRPVEAQAWYERYLAESPGGTYAAEALGRHMMLVERTKGAAAARELARDYTERFPMGGYAKAARQIQER